MPETFVLDTSAVLALRSDESGAARVEHILHLGRQGKARVLLSFMSRMEILYRLTASEGDEAARTTLRLLDATGAQWISCEPAVLEAAGAIKARGGLSVADAWIAGTALVHGAVLVHKDPEFAQVREVAQEALRR